MTALDPRSYLDRALIVPGHPHILLAPDRNPGWQSLRKSYEQLAGELTKSRADLLLIFSTQWVSVIGHLIQCDPRPKWLHVDQNWYELGEIPYEFRVDDDFGKAYAKAVADAGMHSSTVNYHGFPIDTGTIVALKLLNPANRLPACMVSCNIYSEKEEMIALGEAAAAALRSQGKRAIAIAVTSLSNRYTVSEIDPAKDTISSQKDDEWNRKMLELFGEGRLEDASQAARQFAREANADMRFRAVWWLAGLTGQTNRFRGRVLDYQPVWGTGAALVDLVPAETEAVVHEFDEVRQLGAARATSPATSPTTSPATSPATSPTTSPATSPAAPQTVPPNGDGPVMSARAAEPVGAYPHARRHGGLLFVSGIGPRKRGTREIPGVIQDDQGQVIGHDAEAQTRAVIENLTFILDEAGSSLEKVVDVTIYLTDIDRDFQVVNRVFGEVFGRIQPSRTTVGVVALPTPIAVEFKVTALA